MMVTVAVIEDAFLDLQRIDHAGVVICYNQKGDGAPAMVIPGNGVPRCSLSSQEGMIETCHCKRSIRMSVITKSMLTVKVVTSLNLAARASLE